MSGIGVYVRKEVLEHKKRDGKESDDMYCYFTFANSISLVRAGDRFWFASEGRWQGFFTIKRVLLMGEDEDGNIVDLNNGYIGESAVWSPRTPDAIEDSEPEIDQGTEIRFYSESWRPFDGGPRKAFQGFTYNVPYSYPRER